MASLNLRPTPGEYEIQVPEQVRILGRCSGESGSPTINVEPFGKSSVTDVEGTERKPRRLAVASFMERTNGDANQEAPTSKLIGVIVRKAQDLNVKHQHRCARRGGAVLRFTAPSPNKALNPTIDSHAAPLPQRVTPVNGGLALR